MAIRLLYRPVCAHASTALRFCFPLTAQVVLAPALIKQGWAAPHDVQMASRANGLAAGIRGEGPANGAPQSSRRLALLLSYDGAAARGWTSLRDEVLRPALCKVLRQPDADLLVTAASRTDAEVHARGQVCSVDAARPLDAAHANGTRRASRAWAAPPLCGTPRRWTLALGCQNPDMS